MTDDATTSNRVSSRRLGWSVVLLAGCLVVAACSTVTEDSGGSATTEPPPVSDDAGPVLVDPVDDGLARALVSPTGVVVPVIATNEDGHAVLSPCGNEAVLADGEAISGAVVVIDPGHGGPVETGSVGPNGLVEAELNLEVAEATVAALEARGISAVLTRTGDYRVSLAIRARIANTLGSSALVSIHHNGPEANPSSDPGVEVFVQRNVTESQRLGGTIHQAVFDSFSELDIDWQAATMPGVLVVLNADGGDAYGMMRRPAMPAALVELGYLANPAEAEFFATDDYPPLAAEAVAEGIERWLVSDESGTELEVDPRIFTPGGLTGGSDNCEDPPLE